MANVNLGVPREEKMEHGENEGMKYPMMPPGEDSDEVVYPHFHYCGPLDLELPDSGEMVVKFVKRKETSYVEKDGTHWYECKVDIREIVSVDNKEPEAHMPAKSSDAASDALDAIARQLAEQHEAQEGDEDEDESEEGESY